MTHPSTSRGAWTRWRLHLAPLLPLLALLAPEAGAGDDPRILESDARQAPARLVPSAGKQFPCGPVWTLPFWVRAVEQGSILANGLERPSD